MSEEGLFKLKSVDQIATECEAALDVTKGPWSREDKGKLTDVKNTLGSAARILEHCLVTGDDSAPGRAAWRVIEALGLLMEVTPRPEWHGDRGPGGYLYTGRFKARVKRDKTHG